MFKIMFLCFMFKTCFVCFMFKIWLFKVRTISNPTLLQNCQTHLPPPSCVQGSFFPRYRKLIKQLLMNTIILKGTRHEMRMGPSTTISEKMIFVRWAAQPSCPA